jgi:hypothetical protein
MLPRQEGESEGNHEVSGENRERGGWIIPDQSKEAF